MRASESSSIPRRGEIWLVQVPGEQKWRPCLILSADWLNQFAHDVTVVPITSVARRTFPTRVELLPGEGGLERTSWAKCDQVMTIDKRRLGRAPLGRLNPERLTQVEEAVRRALSL